MGKVGEHPQITEYDVNGQFFGWGVQPSAMLSDIKRRLKYGKEHKVSGFWREQTGKVYRIGLVSII